MNDIDLRNLFIGKIVRKLLDIYDIENLYDIEVFINKLNGMEKK